MHNSFIVADSIEAALKEAGDVILSKVSGKRVFNKILEVNGFLKVNWPRLELHYDCSISFNLQNAGEFFSGWILNNRIQVQKTKNKTVVSCLRSP